VASVKRIAVVLLTIAAAAAGLALGWHLVRADVELWQSYGLSAVPEWKFVVFLGLVCAVAVYLLSRRLLLGPRLSHESWILTWQHPVGRRVEIETLRAALRRHGYDLTFSTDEQRTPVDPSTALVGPRLVVRERTARHGELIVQIGGPVDAPRMGAVDSHDAGRGTYHELAMFLMHEVGHVLPGAEWKPADSALSPEPTSKIEPLLPDRPRALPRT
jgi:hypothetical protein